MSLPFPYKFTEDNIDFVLAVESGWLINVSYPRKESTIDLGHIFKITPTNVEMYLEKYQLTWCNNWTSYKATRDIYTDKNPDIFLSPDLKNERNGDKIYVDSDFYNINYANYHYNKNLKEERRCLLSLSGINMDKSVFVIYNKKENRSVAFESPLEGDIVTGSISLDGLTAMFVNKNKICVVDNPLV